MLSTQRMISVINRLRRSHCVGNTGRTSDDGRRLESCVVCVSRPKRLYRVPSSFIGEKKKQLRASYRGDLAVIAYNTCENFALNCVKLLIVAICAFLR